MKKYSLNNICTVLFKSKCCKIRVITRNIGWKSNFLFTARRCHLKCICARFSSQPELNFNKFKSIPRRRNLCNGYWLGARDLQLYILKWTFNANFISQESSLDGWVCQEIFTSYCVCVCIIYICVRICNLYIICNCICTCINMEWR